MNTYRRCKAKKKLKRGELVYTTTVEVFGKPAHVPVEYAKFITDSDCRDYFTFGAVARGRTYATKLKCLMAQRRHDSFVLLVPNLKQLDCYVAAGIKPSNIRLPSELGDAGHEFRITTDGIEEV